MKIAVVTDSGSNIYHQDIKMEGLFAVPLQIIDKDKVYLEGQTITIDQTYRLIYDGKLLKTSLPPVHLIDELFKKIKSEEYDLIFAVPISSGLSNTISAMSISANRIGMPFEFIDCFATASNQLHLAISARKLFNLEYSVEEVKRRLQKSIEDSVTFVIPNDMKHLARGGRITPMAASFAGLLDIKPILKVSIDTGGKNDAFEKVRTMSKAWDIVIDYFKSHHVDENCLICVAHVWEAEKGRQFYQRVQENFPNTEMFFTDLISTVGVHTGLGCCAIQYIRKVELD
jgi:DegV family protein with EDD domain